MYTGALTIPRADLTSAFYYSSLNPKFIGTQILRPLGVNGQNGKIPVVPLEAMHNLPRSAVRNSDGRYNRVSWEPSEDSYATTEYGLEVALDYRKANLYKNYYDFEKFQFTMIYNELRRLQEVRIKTLLHTTGSWAGATNTGAGTAAWSVSATATPVTDVMTGKIQINGKCGADKFGLQISWASWHYATLSAQIRAALQYTKPPSGLIPLDALANALGVDEILIGGAPYNSADSGQTAVLSKIWPTTQAFLYAMPEDDGPEAPCLGRTYFWNEDGGGDEITAEEYVEPAVRGGVGRVRHEVDENLWSTAFGYLITGI